MEILLLKRIPLNFVLFFVTIGFYDITQAQVAKNNYFRLLREADTLYSNGLFADAATKYSILYLQQPHARNAEYIGLSSMECFLAIDSLDSSMCYLRKIVGTNSFCDATALNRISNIGKLDNLPEWTLIKEKIELNRIEKEGQINLPLKETLDALYERDRQLRLEDDRIVSEYGVGSNESRIHGQLVYKIDSINMVVLDSILMKHSWPSIPEVGVEGNRAVWLIIQHASLDRQKKYLPIMRASVLEGNASPADLALLEDRVAIAEGRKQIYGSQLNLDATTGKFYFLPIEDESNVNIRRESVGLEPLEYYALNWGVTYTPVQDSKSNEKNCRNQK